MAMEKLIGREVTLTLKNFSAARHGPFAHLEGDTYDLKGVVMRRPRGHENETDMFGFAVKFTEVPLRVVHIRHVVAVDGIPMVQTPTQKKAKVEVREWKVPNSKGTGFYIVRDRNGIKSCECPANASFRKTCRHIKEVNDGKHGQGTVR